MIYLSAGHHFKAGKADPGAVGNGYKENELTRELRDLTVAAITRKGGDVITDKDSETLGEYVARIKPGSGSVVCEIHFNASANPQATGAESLYKTGADLMSRQLSAEISAMLADLMCIKNRGAKSEEESARGRLAILRTKAGLSCLPEICFISNKSDMESYQAAKHEIAECLADILIIYDAKRF